MASQPAASLLARLLAPLRLFRGAGRRRVTIWRDRQALATLSPEVADTIFRRAKGLMGRPALGADGMLFVYPWPRTVRIWMAGTLIPLDAVFVDRTNAIVKIAADLQAGSRKWVSSDRPVKWVLEIPAGQAFKLGLKIGDRIEFGH